MLVAVLVPCGVLLLAALAALAVWRHQTYRSVLHGGVRAPGAGPNTTLLITGGYGGVRARVAVATCVWAPATALGPAPLWSWVFTV